MFHVELFYKIFPVKGRKHIFELFDGGGGGRGWGVAKGETVPN